jgi:hypothetical protein
MDNDQITILAQEMKVSEEVAKVALDEASGVLEKAREILLELLPRYLVLKIKYLSQKTDRGGGLIFICINMRTVEFLKFTTLTYSNRDLLRGVLVQRPAGEFYQFISNYFEEHLTGSHIFDSQKLANDLTAAIQPIDLDFLFTEWDKPKPDVLIVEAGRTQDLTSAPVRLRMLFEKALADISLQRIEAEVDYEFFTSDKFVPLADILGLIIESSARTPVEKEPSKPPEELFKVYLKGHFIIDPVTGTPLEELQIGDFVYCEVVERSEIAVAVGRFIGAFRRGMWLPIRGVIVDIQDMAGDRKKYRLKLTTGVYVDVLSFIGFRVRTGHAHVNRVVTNQKQPVQNFTWLPLVLAVFIVTALIMSLVLMR